MTHLRITDEQLEAMCVAAWSVDKPNWEDLDDNERRGFRVAMRAAVATLPFDTLDAPERREYEQLKIVAAILGETFDGWKPQTDEGKRMLSLFWGTVSEFMGKGPAVDLVVKRLGAVRSYVFNALNTSQRSREVSVALEHIFKLIEGES